MRKNQNSCYRSFLTRNHWCKILVNKMLNFTYGGKVFFTIQLFERFWAILSSCSCCFHLVVLEKLCMFPDQCDRPTFGIKINPRLILEKFQHDRINRGPTDFTIKVALRLFFDFVIILVCDIKIQVLEMPQFVDSNQKKSQQGN